MIDWAKFWVRNPVFIDQILTTPAINWKGQYSANITTGEFEIITYPLQGKWRDWEFELKSRTWLEIRGSLHKHWNKGHNGNDFFYRDLINIIIELCNFLQVNPYCLTIHNLEFGVNIHPSVLAMVILKNVICFKNRESTKKIRDGMYFIEFETDEYYLKLYDKGLQARSVWGIDIGNVLRVEIKARNSGYFADAGIITIADLLKKESLLLLGKKINKIFKDLIFDDNTITDQLMTGPDKKNYLHLSNPRNWTINRGNKNSTVVAREKRFSEIVNKYGKEKYQNSIALLVDYKWNELLITTPEDMQRAEDFIRHCNLCGDSYLTYTEKTTKESITRKCVSCGKDITRQNEKSKFCSEKFVGKISAKKCRNKSSDNKRKVVKKYGKGLTLFA